MKARSSIDSEQDSELLIDGFAGIEKDMQPEIGLPDWQECAIEQVCPSLGIFLFPQPARSHRAFYPYHR